MTRRLTITFLISLLVFGLVGQLTSHVYLGTNRATGAVMIDVQTSAIDELGNDDSSDCSDVFDCAMAGIVLCWTNAGLPATSAVILYANKLNVFYGRSIEPELSPPIASV